MTIAQALAEGAAILDIGEVPDARRDAETLLRMAISRDKAFLIAHPEYVLRQDELERFRGYVERRSGREPLQYIAGTTEFYGLDLDVTPDVLIPRPETELIVERAVGLLKEKTEPVFCEIGAGSGCIAVSILVNVGQAIAIAGDVSKKALEVAARNADKHGVAHRLELVESDVFGGIPKRLFDLIVSNPPYVPKRDLDRLQAEVGRYEPHTALSDGADGLSIIRKIIREAPRYLPSGGWLLMEIGFDQGEKVAGIFDPDVWGGLRIEPDLQGIPRMVNAVRK